MSTETTDRTGEVDVRPSAYPTVTELLARVMADVTHVGKDGYNKTQSYNFRGIDAVVNAVGPAFRAHGIVPKPMLKKVTYENILVGEKRTPMTRCTVEVKYRFKGPGGDFEDVTVPGEAFDSGDKGTAKAMSVAYRIALLQLLALPTHEPDPDESSYERAPAAVTDQRWLAAVRQRIAAATDHNALNVIGADIGAQADAGQLSMADGNRLRAEFDARWAALAKPAAPDASADGGWSSAPPQDRPAERHHGPVDDEWNTPPATPATGEQITEIVRLLGVKRGVYNGNCARAVSELVRRRIDDPRTLSQTEATGIIETLAAEPDPAPAAPGTPDNPVIGRPEHRMMQALFKSAGITDRDAQHAFIARVLGAPVASRNDITKAQFEKLRHALTTGELPPEPAPAGPNANGEGISEFDALDQMILDVHDPQSLMDANDAIMAELQRGSITKSDYELLHERLDAHVERAKAGAAA